jgi:hypothetical protein
MCVLVDISKNAMAYGKQVGIYDKTFVWDLNDPDDKVPEKQAVQETMKTADVIMVTAASVYLDIEAIAAIESIVGSFASKPNAEGYMLINLLNPFSLEKADETKRVLLKHFDFVGSMVTRPRKMFQLEQGNYPGEEWALLELWVLKPRAL